MAMVSRFFRALVLTTWLYSLLLWLYIVARIVVNKVEMSDLFIDYVPHFTFLNVGVLSFVLSFVCMLTYLSLWGGPNK
jgi:hypothetical protein